VIATYEIFTLHNHMRIAFIINSKSSKAKKAFIVISHRLRHKHDAFFTTAIGSANEIASMCIHEGHTHLAVLGGDGTLNEVFNAMMNSGKQADELPVLCIHPCGTGNDFARNFNLNNDIEKFLKRIDNGNIQYSDGGFVQYANHQGSMEKRHFLNVMDVGIGGCIAQRVNHYRRGRLAFLSYQRSILRTLPFYLKRQVIVKTSSIIYSGPAMSVVVANGKWFGNGLGIAPEAQVMDGQLECVILARVNIWDYLMNLPAIIRCKPINHAEVHYYKTKEMTIEGENNPLELDGEYVGMSPAQIRIMPRAVRLLIG
jgi:YegS/Rv2252/BmrU family lipid kinase